MTSAFRERSLYAGGWMAVGAVGTILMGGTPIGVAMIVIVAGALAWRTHAAGSRSDPGTRG